MESYNDNNHNHNYSTNWWKNKEENLNVRGGNQIGAGSRPRSYNSRKSSFGRQLSSWEKKFCATAGVPWQKVLETQKYMFQDEKVLKWNDSAVKEAFLNAKERFWAAMHGQPCDIKMPDPDIFIDNIDWNANVDPVLLSDLENRGSDISCETEKQDGGVIVGIPVIPEQYVLTPSGWGDAEELKPQPKNCEQHDNNGYDLWDGGIDASKGEKVCSRGWQNPDVTENRAGGGENRDNGSTWRGYGKKGDHGYKYNQKWDHGGYNTSRYKISRFHHNGNRQSLGDDNRYKRGNFDQEGPSIVWRPVSKRW